MVDSGPMQDKTEPIPFPRTFREACRQFFGNGASAHPAVQFLKYGFVGGLATAVNVAAVFLFCWKVFHCITPDDPFVRLFGLEAGPVDEAARARLTNWAYVCAFPISNAFCYALNRMFVFVPGRHGAVREFAEFLTASAIALAAGMAASWILILCRHPREPRLRGPDQLRLAQVRGLQGLGRFHFFCRHGTTQNFTELPCCSVATVFREPL